MDKLLLSLEIITITVAWWLGFYVLARDRHNRQLTFTGMGLLAYGLALVFYMVSGFASGPESNQVLGRWGWPFLFLPALFWAGTLVYLLPESSPLRSRLVPILSRGLLPFAIVFSSLFV